MRETIPFDPIIQNFLGFANKNFTDQDFHCLLMRSFGDTYEEISKTCPRKTKKYTIKGGYKRIENYIGIGISKERVRQLLCRSIRKMRKYKL